MDQGDFPNGRIIDRQLERNVIRNRRIVDNRLEGNLVRDLPRGTIIILSEFLRFRYRNGDLDPKSLRPQFDTRLKKIEFLRDRILEFFNFIYIENPDVEDEDFSRWINENPTLLTFLCILCLYTPVENISEEYNEVLFLYGLERINKIYLAPLFFTIQKHKSKLPVKYLDFIIEKYPDLGYIARDLDKLIFFQFYIDKLENMEYNYTNVIGLEPENENPLSLIQNINRENDLDETFDLIHDDFNYQGFPYFIERNPLFIDSLMVDFFDRYPNFMALSDDSDVEFSDILSQLLNSPIFVKSRNIKRLLEYLIKEIKMQQYLDDVNGGDEHEYRIKLIHIYNKLIKDFGYMLDREEIAEINNNFFHTLEILNEQNELNLFNLELYQGYIDESILQDLPDN